MKQIVDETVWLVAWLNTPFGRPSNPASAHEAMKTASCCVKSKELASPNGFPKETGVLVSYDEVEDQVVVRGHGDCVSPKFVWSGTVAEYFAIWECD
jgi:hypothetical protein